VESPVIQEPTWIVMGSQTNQTFLELVGQYLIGSTRRREYRLIKATSLARILILYPVLRIAHVNGSW
jgi:hypothetical protein